ncbi:DUF3558 domain-containing protein [Nocardia carnea]|uniref:DUF3558 domain-containing protein n=1 Tax=Nocardia carnea TaxID=37328 RepID=UPI0024587951|nr:DUF3558 domain-containing protein [Nocardia carnea]
MRTADVVRAMLATAAAIALATGCTSSTDGATATIAPTTAGPIEIFNPCTELSDQVLRDVGLDPSTKSVTTDAPDGETSWRVCNWRTPDSTLMIGVYSTSHTLDEARKNSKLVEKTETTVGSRPALTYFDETETDGTSCYTAIAAEQGMFEINASWFLDADRDRDICAISTEYAALLEPNLPK